MTATMAQQRAEWVLLHLLNIYPRAICETHRMPIEALDLGVHMGTIRGLEKRGMVESLNSGLWSLTPFGLEFAKYLNGNLRSLNELSSLW